MKGLLRSLHNHRLHLRWSPSAPVTTTTRILATIVKYFEENISFFNWRDITEMILINGFNNGFRTFRRNHMFSVAMCIMSTRALWLGRVCCSYWLRTTRVFFLYFLWLQRSYLTVNFGNFFLKIASFLTVAIPMCCPFFVKISSFSCKS